MTQLNLLLVILVAIFAFTPTCGGWQDNYHQYGIPSVIGFLCAQRVASDKPEVVAAWWKVLCVLTSCIFLALIGLILWEGPVSRGVCPFKFMIGLYYLRISFGLLCVPCFALALSQRRQGGFVNVVSWLGKRVVFSMTPAAIIYIICIVGARCFDVNIDLAS